MVAPIPLTTIPFQIWLWIMIIGMLCMVYGLLRKDMNNYTHIMALALAAIMLFIDGFYCVMGIQCTVGTTIVVFRASWFMLMCTVAGIICSGLCFVHLVDLSKVQNYTDGSTTQLNPVRKVRRL
jgi:hypothetical protein